MGLYSDLMDYEWDIPSGKRLHNYEKSPFLMEKLTINGPFSIAMSNYQRVYGYPLVNIQKTIEHGPFSSLICP